MTRWWLLAGGALLAACAGAEAKDAPPVPRTADLKADLKIDGLVASTPGPGKYAMLLDGTSRGGCSRSSFIDTVSSSVILTLAPDGSAAACRGRRWTSQIFENRTGKPGTYDQLTEQQGLRGTWKENGGWVHVSLQLHDGPCRRGGTLPQQRRPAWEMDCISLEPAKDAVAPQPPVPVLACYIAAPGASDSTGFTFEHPFGAANGSGWKGRDGGGRWLLLGTGLGVYIRQTARGGLNPPPVRTWEPMKEGIPDDAWSKARRSAVEPD